MIVCVCVCDTYTNRNDDDDCLIIIELNRIDERTEKFEKPGCRKSCFIFLNE